MFTEKTLQIVNEAEKECEPMFKALEEVALSNQNKVLKAFQKNINTVILIMISGKAWFCANTSVGLFTFGCSSYACTRHDWVNQICRVRSCFI